MELVSVSAYGKLHGVSKAAAQKWQSRGLLKFRDGKVLVEESDRNLLHAGLGRFADAATRDRKSATAPGNSSVAEVAGLAEKLTAAVDDADDLTPALIAFANKLGEGHHVDLITAQTIKENGLALIRLIEARKRAGEVVEIADAEAVIFEMFRLQRDAWLNFPSRVAPLIAAELAVEADRVLEVLTHHVHQQLSDLGEPSNPLREEGSPAAGGAEGAKPAAQAEPAGVG